MESQSADSTRPRTIADLTEEEFAAKREAQAAQAAERNAAQQAAAERGQWWVNPGDGTGEPPPDTALGYENRPANRANDDDGPDNVSGPSFRPTAIDYRRRHLLGEQEPQRHRTRAISMMMVS